MSDELNFEGLYPAVVLATGLILACVAARARNISLSDVIQFRLGSIVNPLRRLQIKEIVRTDQAGDICKQLVCETNQVLGFDCEWVTQNSKQKPVALLQLASPQGTCGLFRLCKLGTIPEELKDLLEDRNIIKVGVGPVDDAKLMSRDYGIMVKGCLDLRHISPKPGGLATLAQEYVGVKLDKHWKIRCSDWEADVLSQSQLQYAAKDALVAIEIFKRLTQPSKFNKLFFWRNEVNHKNINTDLEKYLDIRYRAKPAACYQGAVGRKPLREKPSARGFSTRKSPLYHNCFMHAPDGELLCSCDQRKAEWYVEKGLATVIPGEPYSIRLFFEPAGRSMNTNEGRFYTQLKGNHCVVCGAEDSYLRHNVVPREYRKHFPDIMKKHQSHDVVLMCLKCHVLSGEHDDRLRRKLAEQCEAPIQNSKLLDDECTRKVQKAAKALLYAGDCIPAERKLQLKETIKQYFNTDIVTDEFLQESLNLETKVANENYEPHGIKVVNYYIQHTTGLLELEKLWREHFLQSMKPKYLPYLWSVSHNHERLAVRAAENRIDPADLEVAGLAAEDVVLQKKLLGLEN